MSMTGLETFDTTLHKTNDWINRLGDLLGWEDKQKSYMVLKTTLQALRDRITVEEVAQLGAQLPMLIRGFYYEGWKPADTPLNVRNRAQFLARINEHFQGDETVDPEVAARAVIALHSDRISDGEIEDVKGVLPAEIRNLWPDAPRARAA